MGFKEKIFIFVLAVAVLNLAFLFGQTFYFSREVANILTQAPQPSNSRLSANLLNANYQNPTLLVDDKELPIDSIEFNTWVERYTRNYGNQQEYRVNEKNVRTFLKNLSEEIDVPVTNAKFKMINGKITEFIPSQTGRALNIPKTLSNIIAALTQTYSDTDQIKSRVVIDTVQPEINLEKINTLGINDLIGHGESTFTGSSKARINNIKVGAKVFNDVLLKPGEEFSFTRLLGPVDAINGYKPELVIKKNKLIPEYGGGICQVSTTLFRAITFAGLPILERRAHSLPVHYYDPQGFDATVYPGSVDLKFKNDTPSYILLQSQVSGLTLSFDIYGTDDGRKVVVTGPRQYNIKPDGSLKAELLRTVIYPDGTKKEDVFKSSYRSPSLFPTVRNPLE